MPKIKLTGQGFENLTGLLGNIEFVDGVSTEVVSRRDAERLGALTSVEDADSGEEMNVAKGIETRLRADNKKTRPKAQAEKVSQETSDEVDANQANDGEANTGSTDDGQDAEGKVYTEAELGAIADEDGIAGLRVIGDKLGVTDKSARGLITKILKAQIK